MTEEQRLALTQTNTEAAVETKDDDDFSWGDFDEGEDKVAPEKTEASESAETKVETEKVETKVEAKSKDWWEVAAEKTGIKAKDESEFIEKSTKKETVKEVFVNEKDTAIRNMKSYLKMDDNELVKADKIARGWGAEKVDKYLEKTKDNIEFEAEDIRASLNSEILNRQREIEANENIQADKRKNEVLALQKNATDYVSKTTEVLGFKVGRDEGSTKKWQEGMATYISSNEVFKDFDSIVKDAIEGKPERLVELAQFMKSKEGIVKGLMQKGKSQEAKKFITELENSTEDSKKSGERVSTEGKKNDMSAWRV